MLKESLLIKRSGYNLIFTSDNVNHIMQTLQENNFLTNGIISCDPSPTPCMAINSMDLKPFNDEKPVIMESCEKVCEIASNKYSKEITEFQTGLTNLLTNSIMKMIRGELINPISGVAAGFIHDIYKNQQKAQKEAAEKIKAEQAKAKEQFKKDYAEYERTHAAPKEKKAPEDNTPHGFTKFTKEQQEYLNKFSEEALTDPATIHNRARIMSKLLDRQIIIIDESGNEKIYDESQSLFMTKKPIILKHDSFTDKWINMNPLIKSKNEYDNIFDAISSTKSEMLRDATQKEILSNECLIKIA